MPDIKKKKIIFIDHTPFVGGAQLSLIAHVESLDQAKFASKIICSTEAEALGLAAKYRDARIPFDGFDFPRLRPFGPHTVGRWFASVGRLRRLLQSEQPDLVVTNTVRASLIGSLAAKLEGMPSCWFIRDMTFPRALFFCFGVLPRKIIFNSKATAKHYRVSVWGSVKGEIVYIGRNFYRKLQSADRAAIEAQKAEWLKGESALLVGFVGRLVHWKGAQVLVAAMKLLAERGIAAKAVILGTGSGQEGDNEAEVKRYAAKNGLAETVIFAGHRNDLVVPMAALDVLALTSIEPEPFSSAVVDAMQAKLVVIGTDIGGTPEAITDGETGLLVAPDQPAELADAIQRLAQDKELFRRLSVGGHARAMQEYTASRTAASIEKIYSSILT
jgi:glycosyltransferase involved in cell wall biosynthesis